MLSGARLVVTDAAADQWEFESRRFGTTASEREHLVAWLQEREVQEIVMESTAQYWKPIWLDLEPHFRRRPGPFRRAPDSGRHSAAVCQPGCRRRAG